MAFDICVGSVIRVLKESDQGQGGKALGCCVPVRKIDLTLNVDYCLTKRRCWCRNQKQRYEGIISGFRASGLFGSFIHHRHHAVAEYSKPELFG